MGCKHLKAIKIPKNNYNMLFYPYMFAKFLKMRIPKLLSRGLYKVVVMFQEERGSAQAAVSRKDQQETEDIRPLVQRRH